MMQAAPTTWAPSLRNNATVAFMVVDDDVAQVDAHAKIHAPVVRHAGVAFGHFGLHLDGAKDGFADAREFGQETVTGELDDTSAAALDGRIDDLAPVRPPGIHGRFLVGAHHPRIMGDVGGQNSGKPANGFRLGHGPAPWRRRR